MHLACPHSPFMFGPRGESVPRRPVYEPAWHTTHRPGWKEWYREGYAGNVQGLNIYVEEAVDKILANSPKPPIIIIQGDHGSYLGVTDDLATTDVRSRFSILNAFYLPGRGGERLYSEISSVNTFRLVFSEYFDDDYPLLEDRSFWSRTEVTDRVKIQ